MVGQPQFFTARAIAAGLGTYKKAVQRRALREHWPRRCAGNKFLWSPPRGVLPRGFRFSPLAPVAAAPGALGRRDLAELVRLFHRVACLVTLQQLHAALPIEAALRATVRASPLPCSPSALRRWCALYARGGLAALCEHRRGHCGRRPIRHQNGK